MKAQPDEISRCKLCGARIGPDITNRPMCYGCGPAEMLPHAVASLHDITLRGGCSHWSAEFIDRALGQGVAERWLKRDYEAHGIPWSERA